MGTGECQDDQRLSTLAILSAGSKGACHHLRGNRFPLSIIRSSSERMQYHRLLGSEAPRPNKVGANDALAFRASDGSEWPERSCQFPIY